MHDINTGDTAWMLVSTGLVLLMTPGLALFYGGLVRRKNILSVLMQCFMCLSLITLLWVVVGYSLAFGNDTLGGFIGDPRTFWMLKDVGAAPRPGGTIPHELFMMYQGMFAIIAPALICGAFAGRMKFSAFMLFSGLWALLVYCPIAHWVWGGSVGFFGLGTDGALDFAGGTVVHISAGVSALMTAIVLGKRQGYPQKISPPHNLPLTVLGAGLLWFGWFGFNGGSALGANASAVNALVVSQVAAAMGGLAWSVIEWVHNGKPTVLGIVTGVVAGLVSITPAAGSVDIAGAMAVGAGAVVFAFPGVTFIKHKLGYDDALDAWGVHGIAGIWGALATGIWATASVAGNDTDGLWYGHPAQLLIQSKAVIYAGVYSVVGSLVLLWIVKAITGLRVDAHDERVGLDLSNHAESAYTLLD